MTTPTWNPPPYDPEVPFRKTLPPEEWLRVVREICARHRVSGDGLAMFPSGSDIVFGGDGIVVKLSRPRWRAEIEAEVSALTHLAGRLSCPTPEVVATGAFHGWPYVIMSRLPGVALGAVWPELARSERLCLSEALGRLAAALHAVPGFPDDGSWPAFLAERRKEVVAHHRELGLSETWLARIEPFLDSVPLREARPVFLHTELLDEHVLVEERGGRWELAGMLDFADSRVGDPQYEIAALIEFIFRGEPGCLPAYLRAYGWDARDLNHEGGRRLAAWGLLHLFGSLPRVLTVAGGPEPADFDELVERLYRLDT